MVCDDMTVMVRVMGSNGVMRLFGVVCSGVIMLSVVLWYVVTCDVVVWCVVVCDDEGWCIVVCGGV